MSALQETLVLEVGDVFMHGGERAETEATGDLLVGRGVAILLGEAGQEVDDLFLPTCNCHAEIVANKRRIARGFVDYILDKSNAYLYSLTMDSAITFVSKVWETKEPLLASCGCLVSRMPIVCALGLFSFQLVYSSDPCGVSL